MKITEKGRFSCHVVVAEFIEDNKYVFDNDHTIVVEVDTGGAAIRIKSKNSAFGGVMEDFKDKVLEVSFRDRGEIEEFLTITNGRIEILAEGQRFAPKDIEDVEDNFPFSLYE